MIRNPTRASLDGYTYLTSFPEALAIDRDRKIELRGLSALQLISDDAFARGLRDFAAYCRSGESHEPVYEPVELFLFSR